MKYGLSLSDRIDNLSFFRTIVSLFFKYVRVFNKLLTPKWRTESTVLIAFHRLGDCVFTLPALKVVLKNANKLVLFCFDDCISIYETQLSNVKIVGFDKRLDFHFGKISKSKIIKKLCEFNPEIIIDLTASIQSASLIIFSNANEVIGTNNLIYRHLYTKYCVKRTIPHLMDLYLDIIKLKYSVINEEELKTFGTKSLINNKVLILPTAGWPAKQWGLNNFIKLAEKLNNNYECIFIFPPNYLVNDVEEYLIENKVEYIITNSTKDLIETIKSGYLFIGNDSGPTHIASMLGLKTFSIYGPTNPIFHIPYGKSHSFFYKKINCSADVQNKMCFTNGGLEGCPSYECMKAIKIDDVFNEVLKLLDES